MTKIIIACIDDYYGDIDGVWNASLALSIVGPCLHEWRNEKRALLPPDPRFTICIARRLTDLDCPSKIAMIAD